MLFVTGFLHFDANFSMPDIRMLQSRVILGTVPNRELDHAPPRDHLYQVHTLIPGFTGVPPDPDESNSQT